MHELLAGLLIVAILINVGTLISIGLLLNYERKANISFRNWIFQYSKDMEMIEKIKEHAQWHKNFVFIRISNTEDCYEEMAEWLS